MKYLLYYGHNTDFVNDQIASHGDGEDVVSVVDGVAWTMDEEKSYYRTTGKNIRTHTITVNYKDMSGQTVEPSATALTEYYNGTLSEVVLFPKEIVGYRPITAKIVAEVPTVNSVDFIYEEK